MRVRLNGDEPPQSVTFNVCEYPICANDVGAAGLLHVIGDVIVMLVLEMADGPAVR